MNKAAALKSLYPNSLWVLRDNVLEWNDPNIPQPSEEVINQEISRLQAEYDSKQYQRDRKKEYPSIEEQLDMLYWDSINGTTNWQQTIDTVKAKHPKP